MQVFTIGHSNLTLEDFLERLKQHHITALADVRSHPYSRYLPHFNQKELKTALKKANIAYVFLGQELGARPNNLECYVRGQARYDKIAATPEFKTGLERLQKGAEQYNIALMCAEQDPMTCHRAILVCPHLQQQGIQVQHITKTGALEAHTDLEKRLLKQHKLDQYLPENQTQIQLALFTDAMASKTRSYEDLLQEAYQLQANKIAYVDPKTEDDVLQESKPMVQDGLDRFLMTQLEHFMKTII
ncbi:MAG: DUF488 domain-containing protein [Kamptonema sp. SIO4C4]|nr:DUF488 domain-containing protein [Kamptonema sp. SIO4C4]